MSGRHATLDLAPGAGHAHPASPDGGAGFLDTRAADAASLVIFAAGAVALAEGLPVAPPGVRAAAAVLGAGLGPLGCAIERGAERPLGWRGALLAGGVAAVVHVACLHALRWAPPGPGEAAARGAAIVALALVAGRLGPRLDRGEAAWRAAARQAPPAGTPPLARWLAARGLPAPWRWLALPLDLPLRAAALLAIRLYQLTLSRLMPPACRFEPTCSRYGFEACWQHGAVRGALLTGLRLLRCSPLSDGGHDPVPPAPPAGAAGAAGRRTPTVFSPPFAGEVAARPAPEEPA